MWSTWSTSSPNRAARKSSRPVPTFDQPAAHITPSNPDAHISAARTESSAPSAAPPARTGPYGEAARRPDARFPLLRCSFFLLLFLLFLGDRLAEVMAGHHVRQPGHCELPHGVSRPDRGLSTSCPPARHGRRWAAGRVGEAQ